MTALMLEVIAVMLGSSVIAGVVTWLANRQRNRSETAALDVATTSDMAADFISANRRLIAAELRADQAESALREWRNVVRQGVAETEEPLRVLLKKYPNDRMINRLERIRLRSVEWIEDHDEQGRSIFETATRRRQGRRER